MKQSLEGTLCPDFSLPCTGDGMVTNEGMKGMKYVLFFYPKDNTPG